MNASLKAAARGTSSAESPWAPDADTTPERVNVLIVDDLPEKLLVFRTVLEELDQNLVCARSGKEALREILQREFAVILLDVNMPDIDGFETAAMIRQYKRSAHTPIIFITSYADEMQTERGYSLGAVDYILSPVVPNVLRSKVQVFVRLYTMQQRIRRQADAETAFVAAEAARRVAEESDRRSALLANASRVLNRSLEFDRVTEDLGRLLVPQLASLAIVVTGDGAAPVDRLLVAAADDAKAAARLQWVAGAAVAADLLAALSIASGTRSRFDLPIEQLARLDASSFGLPTQGAPPSLRAAAALPMLNGDRLVGVLLVAADGVHLDPFDARVLDDLAARAAAALENARLFGSLEREIDERIAAEFELQEASRRKDEFLAMLSHELRNPLAPIRTALEVIRRIAPPDPKFTWASDIMLRQLRQLTRLIEELLDVARISQGKIVLRRETVDLNAVIAQSIESTQPLLDAREQSLHVSLPSEPTWLLGDFARLAQIVSNLLNNASKYSDKRSRIEVIATHEEGAAVVLVRDQGIGIDAELLPRIFELFMQGRRGLDRSQGGLGVGLTLAQRLAEMHDGSLEAASEGVGCGSVFTLKVPRVAAQSAAPDLRIDETRRAAERKCRILVVDDNTDAARSAASFLELEGHELRTAADGAQALEAAAEFRPDVIVLDIGLPTLDGYEVARRLRETAWAEKALILALTGYGQNADRLAAGAAGFDGHFVKPADLAALLSTIDRWTRTQAAPNARPVGVPGVSCA